MVGVAKERPAAKKCRAADLSLDDEFVVLSAC